MNTLILTLNYYKLSREDCALLLGLMLLNSDVRYVEYMEFYEFVKAKFPEVAEKHDKDHE